MIYWESKEYNNYSFIFSWQLWKWLQTAQKELNGKPLRIGGPAVYNNISWIPKWIEVGYDLENIYKKYNKNFCKTSIGCIRKCSFCQVWKVEGKLKELNTWQSGKIVIDNNLLACSKKHFDKVIDSLKTVKNVDFNQGLDTRLLTKYHTERFKELKKPIIRLAFDHIKNENDFLRARKLLKDFKDIRCYVLINYKDNPEDAFCRLELCIKLGVLPNPMRYQPLNTKIKNSFVFSTWTEKKLQKYMRYYSRLRYHKYFKFKDYDRYNKKIKLELFTEVN